MKDTAPKRRTLDERMADAGLPVLRSTTHQCIQLYVMGKIEREAGGVLYSEGFWWRVGPLGAWVTFDEDLIVRMIQELDGIETMEGRTEKKNGTAIRVSSGLCDSVIKLARAKYRDAVAFSREGQASALPRTLGFVSPKGLWTFDRNEGWTCRPPVPDDRVRMWVPVDPDMTKPPREWITCLERVFRPAEHDQDETSKDAPHRIAWLHEWMMACMLGTVTKYQIAPILVGEGENGKSVIIDVIQGLFPPALRASVTPTDLENNRFASAGLVGKSLNAIAEIPAGELLTSANIKKIIDGSEQEGEQKYKDPFKFRPSCGHIFACNQLPRVHDLSHGFWRRWMPLTFNSKIEKIEQRADLAEIILSTEMASIIGYAMKAYEAMMDRDGRLGEVPSREKAIRGWRSDSDTVQQWVDDCTLPPTRGDDGAPLGEDSPRPEASVFRDLYAHYLLWCKESGYTMPVAVGSFGHRLTQLGIPDKRSSKTARRDIRIRLEAMTVVDRARAKGFVGSRSIYGDN